MFEQLPPGTYSLQVQRNGYVRTEYGSKGGASRGTITLGPGETIGALTIRRTWRSRAKAKGADVDVCPTELFKELLTRRRCTEQRG